MLAGVMTIHASQDNESQRIRMVDQHGRVVPLDVRQDGRPPGLVHPGRRTRFKIRAETLAYRVEQVVLGDCEHWHVHDVRVGSQSQLVSVGDSLDEDGFPGAVLSSDAVGSFLSLETVQTAMDLVLEVSYRGPAPDGAPLDCSLRCTAAYGDERDDTEGSLRSPGQGPELVGRWGRLTSPDRAQLGQDESVLVIPQDRDLTIPPGCGAEIRFRGAEHGVPFNAILVQLPDDVARYFTVDKVLVCGRELPGSSAGSLLDLVEDVVGDVVVAVWNTSAEVRDFRAVLWTRYQSGSLVGEAAGWSGKQGIRRFAAWLGGASSGDPRPGSSHPPS